jgi:photosystem II stability/assembly factor-like uncharacterized protein
LGKGTVSRLVVDPGDSNVVYAALFDQGGVYKSTDGGRTWGAASTGIDLDRGWDWAALISMDPSDSQRLYYAGATEGFHLSTNGGQRWTRQSVDCPQVMDFAVDPVDFEHIYAANHTYSAPACLAGVYESSNQGQTWELLTTAEMAATDEPGGDFWHVAADPHDFNTLYAGNHLATHKSSDKGQTWTQIRDDGCDWLATNPSDGTLYCGRGGEIQISHDGGASWSSSHLGGWGRWNSHPFAVAPDDPQTLYAGSDGVMKSADGGETWLRVGWLGAARMRMTVDPRDRNRLFLGGVDSPCETYRSEDGGQTWQAIATDADGCTVVIDPAQNVLYRLDRSQGLYRSGDKGQTWEQFGSGYRDSWQLVPDPQDTMKLWGTAGCGARPLLSEDGGVTFAEVESFPEVICGDPILLLHPGGKRVYVESNGSIYRSDDGGQTWSRLAVLEGHYRAAALSPSDPDTAYFGSTHRGVFKTTNGGRTWFQANSGLTAPSINELAIDPANPETIYAATDGGAFVSLDGGEQWWLVQQGLGLNPIVYSIAVDPNDPTSVYAVTPDGVFRLTETPVSFQSATPVAVSLPTPTVLRPISTPRPTATLRPTGEVDTGMGGSLSIQGVVRNKSGETVTNVYVVLQVYGKRGGWHIHKVGEWGLYTDETGSYSFNNFLRVEGGHYEVRFNGDHEYGEVYENSGYWIGEDEISGDVYLLDVTVHPVTGSAFSGVIQYQDADGSIKSFYSSPFIKPEPGHVIELHRGTSNDNHEYGIGVEYCTIDGNSTIWSGLAGGIYYLAFTYRRSDGVLVRCTSPSFEILPGETKQFEYTIRECPPMTGPLLP